MEEHPESQCHYSRQQLFFPNLVPPPPSVLYNVESCCNHSPIPNP